MRHVDLFSGIGGFALAVDWAFIDADHTFVEIDPFCQKILKKHWPKAQIHDDIKQFKADNLGRVDLLTGGFPCQPFSVAGEQRAQDDDRHLWPEMFRIIKECRPSWVIGENVTGIIELALEQVCLDLESEGYEVWPIVIPACAVNAPHRRDRVWIIATNPNNDGLLASKVRQSMGEGNSDHEEGQRAGGESTGLPSEELTPDPDRERCERGISKEISGERTQPRELTGSIAGWHGGWPVSKPRTVGVDDGIPNRTHRIKSLGNAIVPQVAYEIITRIAL